MTDYATHQATLDRNDLINALLHAGCTIPDSERYADVVIKAGWRAPLGGLIARPPLPLRRVLGHGIDADGNLELIFERREQ